MRIGLNLEKNYCDCFIREFLARTSLEVTFIMAEDEAYTSCEFFVTDQVADDKTQPVNTIFLVGQKPKEDFEVYKFQRFSFVYAHIIHYILKKQKLVLEENMKIIGVLCPGCEEKRTGISLALSSCLAEKFDHVAYLTTEGIDVNDRLLDSPQDEGFTKLFLNIKKQAAMTYFSYQHTHHFYFLGSSRSRKDKRSIKTEDFKQILQCLRNENAFDYVVLELSQELNDLEMWLLTRADTVVSVQCASLYERIKWEESLKRLFKEYPLLEEKCVHLRFGDTTVSNSTIPGMPSEDECFLVAEVFDFFQESSLGVEFDPGRKLVGEMESFVEHMLERMMS
ncbi:hypothetical protein JR334_08830 [Clostridia bacterium]|nr:hypothetical protein JR334_08830 [Clostridia bacterium]